MSTTTTNYGLVKPALSDAPPDITVMNTNWDKVDTELNSRLKTDMSNVNKKALQSVLNDMDITGGQSTMTYGTTDLTAGQSTLATGTFYWVYE